MDFNHVQFGFIGLGLIGGSIAKAIRLYFPDATIIAYNPSRDTLNEAMEDGVINVGRCREDGALDGPFFRSCDIIFLCAPVQNNVENLKALKGNLKDSAILTDIGSTKRDILQHVEEEGLGKYYVGGHPMTGSERTRYHNSEASLLVNAYYIIAPSKEVSSEKIKMMEQLIQSIHAIPLTISCEFHDYAVAGISHLPHVSAAALVNVVKERDSKDGIMHTLAAGGFRDSTRIAASSPNMWEQICMTNSDNLVCLLDDYIGCLQNVRTQIADKNAKALYDFFNSARQYRETFNESPSGAKDLLHTIYLDIEDHPGKMAEVLELLAGCNINIKNISITHNRELELGTLRLEFYSADDRKNANQLLHDQGYTIHEQQG